MSFAGRAEEPEPQEPEPEDVVMGNHEMDLNELDQRDPLFSDWEHVHLFPELHIKTARISKTFIAILTIEGEIWVMRNGGYNAHTRLSPPGNRSRFVDVQIRTAKGDDIFALDEDGYVYSGHMRSNSLSLGSRMMKKQRCSKFDLGCYPSVFLYLFQGRVWGKIGLRTEMLDDRGIFVKDFASVTEEYGFRVFMIHIDGTVSEGFFDLEGDPELVPQEISIETYPRRLIEDLVEPDDALHSIAATQTGEHSRFWLLTVKGRLIVACGGPGMVTFATAYKGLEGIISVSIGSNRRDRYAHHWDGSVYWLGDDYTYTGFKVDSDPCVFRYVERGHCDEPTITSMALYV